MLRPKLLMELMALSFFFLFVILLCPMSKIVGDIRTNIEVYSEMKILTDKIQVLVLYTVRVSHFQSQIYNCRDT